MARVSFLLGLCGSGKSHLSTEIHEISGAEEFSDLFGRNDVARLLAVLRSGRDCVVKEIAMCDPVGRAQMEGLLNREMPRIEVDWICFENDLASANWNAVHRTNKPDPIGHLRINHDWHAKYTLPDGASPRPIFRIPARHLIMAIPRVLERFREDLELTLGTLSFVEVERRSDVEAFGSGQVTYLGPDAFFRLVWDGKERAVRAEVQRGHVGSWHDIEQWTCGPGGAGGHQDSSDARIDMIDSALKRVFSA